MLYAYRSREIQLDDLAKDLDNLNQAYKSQINTNYGMNDELEEVQKQIEKLSLLNDEVWLYLYTKLNNLFFYS